MRERINSAAVEASKGRFAGFNDDEFHDFAMAAAACAGLWRARKGAPPKEDLARRYQQIEKAAEDLLHWLYPV